MNTTDRAAEVREAAVQTISNAVNSFDPRITLRELQDAFGGDRRAAAAAFVAARAVSPQMHSVESFRIGGDDTTPDEGCTFPDTTDCTGEHYCECGKHLDSDGVCPAGCAEDEETFVDDAAVVALLRERGVDASLEFGGIVMIEFVPNRLQVTTAMHGWHYGTVHDLDESGTWQPVNHDPSYDWDDVVAEDERDPKVIAEAWAAWVAKRAALEPSAEASVRNTTTFGVDAVERLAVDDAGRDVERGDEQLAVTVADLVAAVVPGEHPRDALDEQVERGTAGALPGRAERRAGWRAEQQPDAAAEVRGRERGDVGAHPRVAGGVAGAGGVRLPFEA